MRILAALIFFTRLPFWKIANVPSSCFKRIVELWPLVGWFTGSVMALVCYISHFFFSVDISVILALLSRIIITGALHEDGLADFCDAFGGSNDREKTLSIMKDSHIGTYGVLGLIAYFTLIWNILSSLPFPLICFTLIAGDSWSKTCAAQLINILPYARKEEESKSKTVYERMNLKSFILTIVIGLIPTALLLAPIYYPALSVSAFVFFTLAHIMHKRINGYTGDCCGATFLICELSFYMITSLLYNCIC